MRAVQAVLHNRRTIADDSNTIKTNTKLWDEIDAKIYDWKEEINNNKKISNYKNKDKGISVSDIAYQASIVMNKHLREEHWHLLNDRNHLGPKGSLTLLGFSTTASIRFNNGKQLHFDINASYIPAEYLSKERVSEREKHLADASGLKQIPQKPLPNPNDTKKRKILTRNKVPHPHE